MYTSACIRASTCTWSRPGCYCPIAYQILYPLRCSSPFLQYSPTSAKLRAPDPPPPHMPHKRSGNALCNAGCTTSEKLNPKHHIWHVLDGDGDDTKDRRLSPRWRERARKIVEAMEKGPEEHCATDRHAQCLQCWEFSLDGDVNVNVDMVGAYNDGRAGPEKLPGKVARFP